MQKNGTWLVCGAVLAALVFVATAQDAQARPKYMGAFKEAYPALATQADTIKCNVCHFGDKKTNRNDYGMAVGKALGEKNIMDAEKIKEGLKKAEAEKNADGKTFGELIKDGKLPGKAQ